MATLSVLQIDGLVEDDLALRCDFFLGGERTGSVYLHDAEGAEVQVPAEGRLVIEVHGSPGKESLLGTGAVELKSVVGRSRVSVPLSSGLKLVISVPSLPSINEAPETPASEDGKETFSQLSVRALHVKVLELQRTLDQEREKYLVNIEGFVAHHKAVQDRYRLVVESLERKNEKLTKVVETLQTQLRKQADSEESSSGSPLQARVEQLGTSLKDAHVRFIEREKQFREMLAEVGQRSKELEEENHQLKAQIVDYESRIFALTEDQKQSQVRLLQPATCQRCMESAAAIEELRAELGRVAISEQNSICRSAEDTYPTPKSVKAAKVSVNKRNAPGKPQKRVLGKADCEVITLENVDGVIKVNAAGREMGLNDFLQLHNLSSSEHIPQRRKSPQKKQSVVSAELHRPLFTTEASTEATPHKRTPHCEFTVLLSDEAPRSKSCTLIKKKLQKSPMRTQPLKG